MDDRIRRALSRGHLIDITTTGRRTGKPRRIELVFHNFGGHIYISGMPGFPRAWLANLAARAEFTFHLKGAVSADLPARARVITDPAERREVLAQVANAWRRRDIDAMVASSPLVEVEIDGYPSGEDQPASAAGTSSAGGTSASRGA
jgi:deazaflavin-dependent oxidoreductase (nitroreductase family)